jgi:hypothetical protein
MVPTVASAGFLQSTAVVGVRSREAKERDPDTILRQAMAGRQVPDRLLSGRQAESQFPDGTIAASMRQPGPPGTVRVGNHLSIATNKSGQATPFQPARFGMKRGVSKGAKPVEGSQQPPQSQPPTVLPPSEEPENN